MESCQYRRQTEFVPKVFKTYQNDPQFKTAPSKLQTVEFRTYIDPPDPEVFSRTSCTTNSNQGKFNSQEQTQKFLSSKKNSILLTPARKRQPSQPDIPASFISAVKERVGKTAKNVAGYITHSFSYFK